MAIILWHLMSSKCLIFLVYLDSFVVCPIPINPLLQFLQFRALPPYGCINYEAIKYAFVGITWATVVADRYNPK